MFVFSRPDIRKILQERFIVVAADDWYQRRRDDDVGRFFRAVADQGPRKGRNGSTRQGRYVFTASGKLLGYNNNRDPDRIMKMLEESLEAFSDLPEEDRGAGAVKVPQIPPSAHDLRYQRVLEPDTLPVKVYTRGLKKNGGGYDLCDQLETGPKDLRQTGLDIAVDHLWIRHSEVEEILQLTKTGKGNALPMDLSMRIARYHLVDNTRGEPSHWRSEEVRVLDLRLTPCTPKAPGEQVIRIRGPFHLETKDKQRGYRGEIDGTLTIPSGTVQPLFHMVAIGNHWGEGPYTPGARVGNAPLAVVFAVAARSQTVDRIPPQGIRWENGYWNAAN